MDSALSYPDTDAQFEAALDKAARRALTFLQCDFDPRRLEKFEVQQLRVDKKDTCVLTRPPSAKPSLSV